MRAFSPFHPSAALLAFVEGRLSPRRRARIERHLSGCAACRARAERLRETMARLEAWPVDSPPPALDRRFLRGERSAFDSKALKVRWWPQALAAGLLISAGLALYLVRGREQLDLLRASGAPSMFEALALAEHAALRAQAPPLALASPSAPEIRAWLKNEGGFSAALVADRPASEHRFELLGVRPATSVSGRDSVRGAAVAARIDDLPVTLLVGHASEVVGLPDWSLFGKQLQVRRDPGNGTHLLSWKNAGKAYVLVADPALPPKLACQLCHASPRRLATIERVAGEL